MDILEVVDILNLTKYDKELGLVYVGKIEKVHTFINSDGDVLKYTSLEGFTITATKYSREYVNRLKIVGMAYLDDLTLQNKIKALYKKQEKAKEELELATALATESRILEKIKLDAKGEL